MCRGCRYHGIISNRIVTIKPNSQILFQKEFFIVLHPLWLSCRYVLFLWTFTLYCFVLLDQDKGQKRKFWRNIQDIQFCQFWCNRIFAAVSSINHTNALAFHKYFCFQVATDKTLFIIWKEKNDKCKIKGSYLTSVHIVIPTFHITHCNCITAKSLSLILVLL